jgi:hypothetical protein
MFEIRECIEGVANHRIHWREARGPGAASVIYVHGVPTASWEWLPWMWLDRPDVIDKVCEFVEPDRTYPVDNERRCRAEMIFTNGLAGCVTAA